MANAAEIMRSVSVRDAIGSVLCHDITRIAPGEFKGPVFRKGHVVAEEDIPMLLNVGKEHLYVYERHPGILHENDAAERIALLAAGNNLRLTSPREGRINMIATHPGLLRVNTKTLAAVNSQGEISLATLHGMQEVGKDQPVAGVRITPLVIEEEKIASLERFVSGPIVEVLPLRPLRVGIVTTGSEILHGRIKDSFGPVLREKSAQWGCSIIGQTLTGDDAAVISSAIAQSIRDGAEMIWVTGGMSVDPDDRTPLAVRNTGATIVSYGAPTFPGAMFMLAYLGSVPILGLPGCVMYHKASIFDLIAPRLLAGLTVSREDMAMLGHGGFCASCPECRYPLCSFGKG